MSYWNCERHRERIDREIEDKERKRAIDREREKKREKERDIL